LCERSFAHVCDTGGTRRSWLRGLADVTKRYLIAVAAHNLGRILRSLFGVGKPKALQRNGEDDDLLLLLYFTIAWLRTAVMPFSARLEVLRATTKIQSSATAPSDPPRIAAWKTLTSTGC